MINEEQDEALESAMLKRQAEIDDIRNGYLDFLTEEQKSTYKFLEQKLNEFAEAKIPVYIYSLVPTVDLDGKPVKDPIVIQYNNLRSINISRRNSHILKKGIIVDSIFSLHKKLIQHPIDYTPEEITEAVNLAYQLLIFHATNRDPILNSLSEEGIDNGKS